MQPDTDEELEQLLSDLESDSFERKGCGPATRPRRVARHCARPPTTLPGGGCAGAPIVGARDDGSPSRAEISDRLVIKLADVGTNGETFPPAPLIVGKRRLRGADLAVVTVASCDSPPVRLRMPDLHPRRPATGVGWFEYGAARRIESRRVKLDAPRSRHGLHADSNQPCALG